MPGPGSCENQILIRFKSKYIGYDIQYIQSRVTDSSGQSFDILGFVCADRILYLQLSAKFSLCFLLAQPGDSPSCPGALHLFRDLLACT